MNKIRSNFTKNLTNFCICFSENFDNFDEIRVDVENDFNKVWLICTIYKKYKPMVIFGKI